MTELANNVCTCLETFLWHPELIMLAWVGACIASFMLGCLVSFGVNCIVQGINLLRQLRKI
jgi:hypothetical protein